MRGDEVSQLQLRLRQEAARADKLDRGVPGRFVAGEERALAEREARSMNVEASFDGGWEDAERVQVSFHPQGDEAVFTGVWVEVRWHARFAHVDHRDLLGSLMGLGMDRAFFGDLIALEDRAYLYALPEAAVRLPMEWTQAGRSTIEAKVLDRAPALSRPEGQMLRDTVPSTRLDAVLAAGMKLSRSRAAEIIRQGSVMVDHRAEERVDRALEAGQLISVRGFGRIRLAEVGDPTRKDRLPVSLEIFKKT